MTNNQTVNAEAWLRKNIFLIALFTDLLIFDFVSKWLVQKFLEKPVAVIPRFLDLSLSYNEGVAFSIPIPNQIMIFLTPLLILALIIFIVRSCNIGNRMTIVILMLFLAGALGNFINRLWTGAVIDFIDFSFWPSFNFADAYLTVGTFLLITFYGKIVKTAGSDQ